MDIFRLYLDWFQLFSFYQNSPVDLTRYWTNVGSLKQTEYSQHDSSCSFAFRWPRTRMQLNIENAPRDAEYARQYMPFFSGILRVDPFSLQSFPVPYVHFIPTRRTKTLNDVVVPSSLRKSLNDSWNQNQSDKRNELDVLIRACGSFSYVSIVEIEIYSAGQDTENRPPLDFSPLLGTSVRRVFLINCPVLPRTNNDLYARTNIIFSGDHRNLKSIHFLRAQTVTPRYRGSVQQPHFIQPTLSDGTFRRPLSVSSSILSRAKELKGFCDMVKRLKKSGVRVKQLFITLNINALDSDRQCTNAYICLPRLKCLKEVRFRIWRNYYWVKPTLHPVVQHLVACNPYARLVVIAKQRNDSRFTITK